MGGGGWENYPLANTVGHVLLIIATSVTVLLLLHLRVSDRLWIVDEGFKLDKALQFETKRYLWLILLQ